MKKINIPLLLFFAVALYCCKSYRPVAQPSDVVFQDNEVADYLHGYDFYMHNDNGVFRLNDMHVAGDTVYGKTVKVDSAAAKQFRHKHRVDLYSDLPFSAQDSSATKTVAFAKKDISGLGVNGHRIKTGNGDGDGVGIAIGLLILFVLIGILIIIGLIYLLVQGTSNAANNSSNGGSGSNSNSGNGGSSSGCYVATMVYGSYDAPEVLVLRKFRDETLSRSAAGRAFIQWYYAWSPGFVKKYNHLRWLHRLIKTILDRLVNFLSRKG